MSQQKLSNLTTNHFSSEFLNFQQKINTIPQHIAKPQGSIIKSINEMKGKPSQKQQEYPCLEVSGSHNNLQENTIITNPTDFRVPIWRLSNQKNQQEKQVTQEISQKFRLEEFDLQDETQNWTQFQQNLLFSTHKIIGNKWAKITHMFPGKSINSVKNRFYCTLRRGFKNLNNLIRLMRSKSSYKTIHQNVLAKLFQVIGDSCEKKLNIPLQLYEMSCEIKEQLVMLSTQDLNRIKNQSWILRIIQDLNSLNYLHKKRRSPKQKNRISILKGHKNRKSLAKNKILCNSDHFVPREEREYECIQNIWKEVEANSNKFNQSQITNFFHQERIFSVSTCLQNNSSNLEQSTSKFFIEQMSEDDQFQGSFTQNINFEYKEPAHRICVPEVSSVSPVNESKNNNLNYEECRFDLQELLNFTNEHHKQFDLF